MKLAVIVGAVVALILSATTALAFQSTDLPPIKSGVDLDTTGNSATAIGPTDACRSVNVGDTFDFDIVVRDVPPPTSDQINGGVAGYGFNIHFDPAVIQLTKAQDTIWVNSDAPFERIAANYTDAGEPNGFPATTGNTRIDFVNIHIGDYAVGDGILSRISAKAVGSGKSTITVDSEVEALDSPSVLVITTLQADSVSYDVSEQQNALVTVGEPCESPPTPFDPEETTPTPKPSASAGPTTPAAPTPPGVPIGDTKLAIDAATAGNSATTVGSIDSCASAKKGDVFQVDVVIQGAKDLLAFDVPISYDKNILRVVDRNVKLFLQANEGSNVFDASKQTPDETGLYEASASDLADPITHDSGDGVLARITFEAIGDGTSPLKIDPVDTNNDRQPDKGVLLKNTDTAIIGDNTGDGFFDGARTASEIRVGAACPAGAQVEKTQAPSGVETGGSSSSDTWIIVAIAAVIVAVVAGAAGTVILRRRRGSASP